MAELQSPDPFHKAETFIVGLVCIISVLITAGEFVYTKFIKSPLPVQIGVVIALVILVVWLIRLRAKKS
jgi:hypothetical protein